MRCSCVDFIIAWVVLEQVMLDLPVLRLPVGLVMRMSNARSEQLFQEITDALLTHSCQ